MSKNQYVILTGGKNNAGDYLIKYRAKALFKELRPNRDIIDYDAWKPFTKEQLDEVNNSKALILCGGPALQRIMRPNIYPMVDDLSKIKVPIIMMGIGWKSMQGDWEFTHNYKLTNKTRELLETIDNSGYLSSVRDYCTLNTLFAHGSKNILMTGCPALYSLEHIKKPVTRVTYDDIDHVSYSMGVSFVSSPSMESVMKDSIMAVKDYFQGKDFEVVFHHSIDKEKYLQTHNARVDFINKHLEFIKWLDNNNIKYKDISGSEKGLIDHYSNTSFHLGFRVHAHIFMSSISRPSLLINEDGRGKALKDVISGLIFDAYLKMNKYYSVYKRLKLPKDPYKAYTNLTKDIINNIHYELYNNHPRFSLSRNNIDSHYNIMKRFMEQLP